MSLELSIENKGKYLYASVTGGFDLAQAKQMLSRTLESCAEQGLSRLLLDCFGVTGEPTTSERFDFASFVASEQRRLLASGALTASRIALAGCTPLLDVQRFGETVALNRGAVVEVADSVDEALEWLDLGADTIREESGE